MKISDLAIICISLNSFLIIKLKTKTKELKTGNYLIIFTIFNKNS